MKSARLLFSLAAAIALAAPGVHARNAQYPTSARQGRPAHARCRPRFKEHVAKAREGSSLKVEILPAWQFAGQPTMEASSSARSSWRGPDGAIATGQAVGVRGIPFLYTTTSTPGASTTAPG